MTPPKETTAATFASLAEQARSGELAAELAQALGTGGDDPGAAPAEPSGEAEPAASAEAPAIHPVLQELLNREKAPRGKPGDPEGTHRDEYGQLRRDDNLAILAEPAAPARATGQITTENEPPAGELKSIKIPGRQPGEEVDFAPRTAEEDQRIRQLVKGYRRGSELDAREETLQSSAEELEGRIRLIQQAPLDFVMEQLDAADQAGLAQRLLAGLPKDQFDRVMELATAWKADALARENVQLTSQNERHTQRQRHQQTETARRDQNRAVAAVVKQVNLLAETLADEQAADQFYTLSLGVLEKWTIENARNGRKLDPADVPAILKEAGTLKLFGLGEETADPPATKPARPKAPAPAATTVQRAKEAGPQFRKRTEQRKDATSIAPVGNGAVPGAAAAGPPAGQGLKDRIAWAKARFGRRG